MRGALLVVASFGATILCWGAYGPTLHAGQEAMAVAPLTRASIRPFICVGLAYFLIGVIVPAVLLWTRGENGGWTLRGTTMSLLAGALGALGALGIVLAFRFGGKPTYVMPLVFGGAPVVNSFLTIYLAKKMKEVGPVFLAGLLMVVMGAVTVLMFAPKGVPHAAPPGAEAAAATPTEDAPPVAKPGGGSGSFLLQLLSIALVIACWGAYGPTLHIGQSAMQQSRFRPLLCVGLAYFVIAVVLGVLMLRLAPESSQFNFSGTAWSLAAGAAGALGALGIIMAFNFGGKPVYVMPLVFGGAPVVNTLITAGLSDAFANLRPATFALFLAGLMLVIAGSALVLVFAPKGAPPKPAAPQPAAPAAG